MGSHFNQWGHTFRWLVLLSCVLSLGGCTGQAEPTATPPATPDHLAIYLMLTEKYTSPTVIVRICDMPTDETTRILHALESISPPAGLEPLHEQAVDAYRYICQGKRLLPGTRGVLRAEGLFMIDWGIGRLLDYREQVDQWRQQRTSP